MSKRRWIKTHGPDRRALERAIGWLGERAKGSAKAYIAVNTKQTIENIDDTIGRDVAQKLIAGKPVTFSGVHLEIFTLRTTPGSVAGPILALYPKKDLLDVIDDMPGLGDVLVVPWVLSDVEPWVAQWGVMELDGTPAPTRTKISDPVAEAAVDDLIGHVNCADHLTNDGDRAAAINTFEILLRNRVLFHPDEVRAQVMTHREGNAPLADAIAEISRGVAAGKRFRNARSIFRDDIIDKWRERAAKAPK